MFSASLAHRACHRSRVAPALCGRRSPHASAGRRSPRAAATSLVARGLRRGVRPGYGPRPPASTWPRAPRASHARSSTLRGLRRGGASARSCARCVCRVPAPPHACSARRRPPPTATLPFPGARVPRPPGICPLGSAVTARPRPPRALGDRAPSAVPRRAPCGTPRKTRVSAAAPAAARPLRGVPCGSSPGSHRTPLFPTVPRGAQQFTGREASPCGTDLPTCRLSERSVPRTLSPKGALPPAGRRRSACAFPFLTASCSRPRGRPGRARGGQDPVAS